MREGGDDDIREVRLTPGMCPRISNSACMCEYSHSTV